MTRIVPGLRKTTLTCLLPALLLGLLLGACSGESGPEAEIRAVLEEMREALEAGDRETFMAHVSADYQDPRGHDQADIARQVDAWRRSGGDRIGVAMDIEGLAVDRAGRATVHLTAGFGDAEWAGRLRGRLGERYRVELSLDHEDGETWRVVRAEWDRDE